MTQDYYEDEWEFRKVLQQHSITDEVLLLSLNKHMDDWATAYNVKQNTAKKAAYNEMLCHALQLSIRGRKEGESDSLLEEFIATLQDVIKEEVDNL